MKIQYPGLIEIDEHEPIQNLEWYKWLKTNEHSDIFHETLFQFYQDFDREKHIFPQRQLDMHRWVYQWYHIGDIDKEEFESLKSDEEFIEFFYREGYINKAAARMIKEEL